MMQVAVTGEGPTDYGKAGINKSEWSWGPVGIYINRIAQENGKNVELIPIPRNEVESVKLQGRSLRGLSGKAIPARRFSILCQKNKYEKGFYYSDADHPLQSKNTEVVANREWQNRYDEITQGLNSDSFKPIVPLRMIENWMLGDYDAFEKVLGKPDKPQIQLNKCEYIWGDEHNPSSDYPKNYLSRVIKGWNKKNKDTNCGFNLFTDIAENQSLSMLNNNCSKSFKVFYDDVKTLIDA